MATYTSSQSGNWVDNSTWGGGGHPVSGDTATIRSVDTVTVTSSAVVGNSGVTGTDCLTIQGALIIATGQTLTVQRDALLSGGTITMNAGSTWHFSGTYKLHWSGTTGNTLTINGTSGSRCTFDTAVANYFWMTYVANTSIFNVAATYCNFTRFGDASDQAFFYAGSTVDQSLVFTNCLFNSVGRIDYSNDYHVTAASILNFINCDFRNILSSYLLIMGDGGTQTSNANTKVIQNCTFVASSSGSQILLRMTGIANPIIVTGNISEDVLWSINCTATVDNVMRQPNNNEDNQLEFGTADPITIHDCYQYVNNGVHAFEDTGSTGAVICQDNISFCEGATPGTENHYVLGDGGTSNFNWTIQRCICVGDNAVVARNASYQSTLIVERLTHVCIGTKADTMFTIETDDVGASSTINLRSNISYSTTVDTLLADNLVDSTANQVDYTDYNCVWDRSLTGRYGVSILITGKSVGQAGFGGSDIRRDPTFNKVNASIQTWDTSLYGAGTVANAFAEMLKLNGFDRNASAVTFNVSYTKATLLTYLRTAFTPTTSFLKATGYLGEDIGAIAVVVAGGGISRVSGQGSGTSSGTSYESLFAAFPNNVTTGNLLVMGCVVLGSSAADYATTSNFTKYAGSATLGTITLDATYASSDFQLVSIFSARSREAVIVRCGYNSRSLWVILRLHCKNTQEPMSP